MLVLCRCKATRHKRAGQRIYDIIVASVARQTYKIGVGGAAELLMAATRRGRRTALL